MVHLLYYETQHKLVTTFRNSTKAENLKILPRYGDNIKGLSGSSEEHDNGFNLAGENEHFLGSLRI